MTAKKKPGTRIVMNGDGDGQIIWSLASKLLVWTMFGVIVLCLGTAGAVGIQQVAISNMKDSAALDNALLRLEDTENSEANKALRERVTSIEIATAVVNERIQAIQERIDRMDSQ